jgi:hypothetical protein
VNIKTVMNFASFEEIYFMDLFEKFYEVYFLECLSQKSSALLMVTIVKRFMELDHILLIILSKSYVHA